MNIIPYPKNAKQHPKNQVLLIAKSIQRFGWRQPIVVNSDHVIIVGHGRWEAYTEHGDQMKLDDPWIVDHEGKTLSGEACKRPLTQKEEKAYRLADNQINALSKQDMELVRQEVIEIGNRELVELTGHSTDLLIEKDDKDDELPELGKKAKTKLGDVYLLGKHVLVCGDSTTLDDVQLLMGNTKGDLVFTDPPYNVNYKGKGKTTKKGIMNDHMKTNDFNMFLKDVFKRYGEISKDGAAWYVFHASSTQDAFMKAIREAGWDIRAQIIWNKPSASMGWGAYRFKHEPLFYCGKEKTKFYGDRTNTTIWDFHKNENDLVKWAKNQLRAEKEGITTIWTMQKDNVQEYKHPTQKPVELIAHALHNSSKAGDIVVDLFGGSGATLIACEKYNREARLMELDPLFVDLIVSRYCLFTDNHKIVKNGKQITWKS